MEVGIKLSGTTVFGNTGIQKDSRRKRGLWKQSGLQLEDLLAGLAEEKIFYGMEELE